VHPGEGKPTNFDYFNKKKSPDSSPTDASKASPAEAPPVDPATEKDITSMNIRSLKTFIAASGLSHSDCLEKAELQERAREAAASVAAKGP
jgi:hypothetical protein